METLTFYKQTGDLPEPGMCLGHGCIAPLSTHSLSGQLTAELQDGAEYVLDQLHYWRRFLAQQTPKIERRMPQTFTQRNCQVCLLARAYLKIALLMKLWWAWISSSKL